MRSQRLLHEHGENAGGHIISTSNSPPYDQASPSLKWLHSLFSLTQENPGKVFCGSRKPVLLQLTHLVQDEKKGTQTGFHRQR